MFTDMVGYTALGQRNESLSLALVEEQRKLVRPILARHNGREIKTIGDAFLIEFPNALDAVRCAYDIQRATREYNISLHPEQRFHLRIGVHDGDVVESQGDISGDAVNVASRIEPLAEDGGVCLTQEVFNHVRNKFELPLSSLGPKSLKNVTEPVEVYKIVMPWEKEVADSSAQVDAKRIAILPFANMSPDQSDEYFADGMTEELISTLSKVKGMEVISRTSVMQYRKNPKTVKELSRELEVGTILEGSVRKAGNKLRITVQMIDANKDKHLWADSYDRDLNDVFAIQGEVAQRVADSLELHLGLSQKAEIAKGPTANVEAYTLFLRGLHLAVSGFYFEDREKAISYFEQAIKLDPGFALAYSWLSNSCVGLSPTFASIVDPKEAIPKAEKAMERALALEPNSPDVHLAMARLLRAKLDWRGAEREVRKALELNPGVANGHYTYAWILASMGRFQECLAEADKALELGPVSAEANEVKALAYYSLRDYDKAIEYVELMKDCGAHPALVANYLGWAYFEKSEYKRALEEWEKADTDVGVAYAKLGRIEETKKILHDAEKASESKYVTAWGLVEHYMVLGEREKAIRALQKAYDNSDAFSLGIIKMIHLCDDIIGDPRVVAILRKVGLEQ
jgi:adenylate cyclase